MSPRHTVFANSTCTILGCTSDDFWHVYENDQYPTEVLSNDVIANVLEPNHNHLRAADSRYRLDHLLSGMLEHAPHTSGKRYVAVALYIAHQKGTGTVINIAKAWMEHLFLPSERFYHPSYIPRLTHSVLALSKYTKNELSSGQTAAAEATFLHTDEASQSKRNDFGCNVGSTYSFSQSTLLR